MHPGEFLALPVFREANPVGDDRLFRVEASVRAQLHIVLDHIRVLAALDAEERGRLCLFRRRRGEAAPQEQPGEDQESGCGVHGPFDAVTARIF